MRVTTPAFALYNTFCFSQPLLQYLPSLSPLPHPSNTMTTHNADDTLDLVLGTSNIPSHMETQHLLSIPNMEDGKDSVIEIPEEVTNESAEDPHRKKKYSRTELRDLVHLRLEMQPQFEATPTHQALWIEVGIKLAEKGHYKRPWTSYRDKWAVEMQRFQKKRKAKLEQSGFSGRNKGDALPLLVFEDDILQDIERVMHQRIQASSELRFQCGPSGRAPTSNKKIREIENFSKLERKRQKKSVSSKSTSGKNLFLNEALERIEKMDVKGSLESCKEILHDIVTFNKAMVGGTGTGSTYEEVTVELTLDKKVDNWLRSIGREKYGRHFIRMGVDWMSIAYLQEVDIIEKSGLPIAISRHLWAEIQKLKSKRGFGNS